MSAPLLEGSSADVEPAEELSALVGRLSKAIRSCDWVEQNEILAAADGRQPLFQMDSDAETSGGGTAAAKKHKKQKSK